MRYFVNILSAVVLLASVVLLGWLMYFTPRLGDVDTATRALPLIVGRTMDLREALGHAPPWERRLYELLAGDTQSDLTQAIAWYEELAAEEQEPVIDLQLAVLEGEAGRLERLRRRVAAWDASGGDFRALLAVAYLRQAPPSSPDVLFQQTLRLAALEDWFYDTLAQRWGTRAGDAALVAAARRDQEQRARPLLWRVRILAGLEILTLIIGAGMIAVVLRRGRDPRSLRVAEAPIPPPWSGPAGGVVLLRGAAIGLPLVIATGFLIGVVQSRFPAARVLSGPMSSVMFIPVILLARRHLRPAGERLRDVLGLRLSRGHITTAIVVALAALGAGAVGDVVIGLLSEAFDLSTHWTEWFTDDLVWGRRSVMLLSFFDLIVLAPVLEEIVFRGLLFATLRRGLPFGAAAITSALVFALGHGYGGAGLASVFWMGVVLAWVYEKTGSVVPGMIVHGASNLLAVLAVILLLRS